MEKNNFFVTDLSTTKHIFSKYHFCRGNSNKRKTRIGIIIKGQGTYIYLNKKLTVNEGDVVFIPENIYCYSEWIGDPDIEVMYVSSFIHYDGIWYEPQIIVCDGTVKENLLKINELLQLDYLEYLEAYSLFYKILQKILPQMIKSEAIFNKTLKIAIEYITNNWNQSFSIGDVAKECCISESRLHHLFQQGLGQTPIKFLNSIRINMAIEYLENENYSIATISNMTGFNSENHFRKTFTEVTGTTPLKYRKQLHP